MGVSIRRLNTVRQNIAGSTQTIAPGTEPDVEPTETLNHLFYTCLE